MDFGKLVAQGDKHFENATENLNKNQQKLISGINSHIFLSKKLTNKYLDILEKNNSDQIHF